MSSANSGPLSNWAWGGPADLTLEWASKVPSQEGLQASRVGLHIFGNKTNQQQAEAFSASTVQGSGPDFQKPRSDLTRLRHRPLPRLPGQLWVSQHPALLQSPFLQCRRLPFPGRPGPAYGTLRAGCRSQRPEYESSFTTCKLFDL